MNTESNERPAPPMPDWVPKDGPYCLKQWILFNTLVDCCLRERDHNNDCRGIHSTWHNIAGVDPRAGAVPPEPRHPDHPLRRRAPVRGGGPMSACRHCGENIEERPLPLVTDTTGTGPQPMTWWHPTTCSRFCAEHGGIEASPVDECPFCGHGGHRNERCAGTSDDGAYPCACSFPDPENFTFVEEVTLDGEPVTPDDGDMLARSDYRRFLNDPEIIKPHIANHRSTKDEV